MSFAQCSSPVEGSLNPLLLSTKWMLATVPHHRECINLHQSAYLDQNRYRARYPHHRNIPYTEELYANGHVRPANWRFQKGELRTCYRLGPVACRAAVDSALESAVCVGRVEVHLFLCVSSVSADSLRCHFGEERSRQLGFNQALLGVIVSQPSAFCAQELNSPLLLFSDLGAWFLNEEFSFLECGARKAVFGHFAHIQRQAHVGLFQLYPTSLPCHSCRHVENPQDIRWVF